MNKLKRIALISTYVVSLFFYLFQGGRSSILIFGVLNALIIYLLFCYVIGMRKLSVTRKIGTSEYSDKQFIAEQLIPVTVKVQHDHSIPLPYMKVQDELIRHNGEVKGFQGTVIPTYTKGIELNYTIHNLKRGVYHFNVITCATYDVFGILEMKRTLSIPEQIQVLPKMMNNVNWEHLLSGKRGLFHLTTQDRYAKESNQQSGIREYVHGDRLSRVHWNATARTGQWKSKDYEKESMPRGVVILDRYSSQSKDDKISSQDKRTQLKYEDIRFESLVSIAASLLQYGMNQKQLFSLESPGKELWSSAQFIGASSYWQAMKHLITVEATSEQKLSSLLLRSILNLVPGSTLMIVTTEVSSEMLQAVTQLKQKNFYPIIFYSNPTHQFNDSIVSKAKPFIVAGIPFYDLSYDNHLYNAVGGDAL